MFRASLCPSSGEQECALPHIVFCTACVGWGYVELGRCLYALYTLCKQPQPSQPVQNTICSSAHSCSPDDGHNVTVRIVTFTVHTARVPAPHNHSHHNQFRTPYVAVHTLVLLMMGVIMPETCWDKSLILNIRLVASCWFLSLYPRIFSQFFWALPGNTSTSIYAQKASIYTL